LVFPKYFKQVNWIKIMKKVFMFVNVDWFFLSHRLPIAKAAVANNIEMIVYTDFTKDHGATFNELFEMHQSPLRRTTKSLLHLIFEIFSSFLIIFKGKPDLIHAVTIKPILILGVVARLTSTPFVGAISGLGPAFVGDTYLRKIRLKIIIFVFKFVFGSKKASVICQSVNDRDTLISVGVTSTEKVFLINGSGVDVDLYSPDKKLLNRKPYVLMASRMLGNKGVREFCMAAKIVNEHLGRRFTFKLSGPVDSESPTFISNLDLIKLCKGSGVEYLGNRTDMPELIASAVIFVLPSYYAEGVPKVLLEASACGVAIVTTDHPGCRDAIISDETGILVKPRDSAGLAKAVLELLEDDEKLRNMGENGRKLALSIYRDSEVVKQHYTLYRSQFT
jgi:glycosyltransferase involved in cell wall biosynthesis